VRSEPRRFFTALLLGGSLVAATLLAELVLRIYARVGGETGAQLAAHDPLRVLIEPMGPVGYRHHPGAVLRYANGTVATTDSLGFRGAGVARVKPVDVIRIALLGGSTTHGWFVDDDETIDAHMRRILADRMPGQRFEVLNAGLDGYDSYQLLERFRIDVLPMAPDIVIVNSGINDVRNARFRDIVDGDPRTLLYAPVLERLRREARDGPGLWSIAKHYSLLLRLPGFLRLRLVQGPPEARAGDLARLRARDDTAEVEVVPYTPDAADYFARNLARIAAAADTAHVALILSTPPSALRLNFSVQDRSVRNYWIGDAATTAAYRDSLAARMRTLALSRTARGIRTPHLEPQVPASEFLDDAHLTSDGNRRVAAVFVDAVLELLVERRR
jgi:lysophospholipase L1-like esterase